MGHGLAIPRAPTYLLLQNRHTQCHVGAFGTGRVVGELEDAARLYDWIGGSRASGTP